MPTTGGLPPGEANSNLMLVTPRVLPPRLFGLLLCAFVATTTGAHATLALNRKTAFPAPGATNIPPDAPLRLTFAAPPQPGLSGRIQVFDAATKLPVDTIDAAAPVATKTIGGLPGFRYYRVLIAGNDVILSLKPGALGYGRSYYVTINAGTFIAGADRCDGIGPDVWRFSTRAAPPAQDTTRVTVAADGSGDFCTVQGALDFIPEGNTLPRTIFIRRGTYHEIVFFTDKHALTLLGEDRKQTVIEYPNNAKFNDGGGNPYAKPGDHPSDASVHAGGHIYRRGVFLAHRVNDLTLANLTFRNTTPQGGSQAEALILNGTTAAHAIIKDVDFSSFQDTIQFNGQTYVTGCFIEGDVDFMWGTGPCFFENCTARSLRSGTYYTQVRNPATNHGFVFLRCTFDGAPGVTDNYLTRIEPHRFPHSEVVLLDCTLTDAVGAPAWLLQLPRPGTTGSTTSPDISQLHFWEFNSHTSDGKPVDASQRLPVSRQLTPPADAALIHDYSDPPTVLGDGWNPKQAAIFR
jgi:pectin methylesterase-like acyl-CoA thioesterase